MKFTKMHGLGNDFVMLNCLHEEALKELSDPVRAAVKLCRRQFAVGADGLILILPSKTADFQMRIFNPDGSEAEMCGNGIRCFTKYLIDKGITAKKEITVETLSGIKKPKLEKGMIKVDMGEPNLDRSAVGMEGHGQFINQSIQVNDKEVAITAVSMGNPHAVIFVETFNFHIEQLGKEIEHNELFTKRTNVEFVQIVNDKELDMCVWERGAGVTLACGTGACAATVAAVLNNKSSRHVTVHLLGGDLTVEWNEKDNHVYMTGPAETAFEGEIDISKYK